MDAQMEHANNPAIHDWFRVSAILDGMPGAHRSSAESQAKRLKARSTEMGCVEVSNFLAGFAKHLH
jgi:hypothetical protein